MRALSVFLAAAAALICTSCDMFQTRPPELAVDAYARAQERMGLFEDGILQRLIKEGKVKIYQNSINRLVTNYSGS